MSLSYASIIFLLSFSLIMYFRDDEEDKTGAPMIHTMFNDQQVLTFVGQWHCFPGPDKCIQLILLSPNLSETCATIPSHHFSL